MKRKLSIIITVVDVLAILMILISLCSSTLTYHQYQALSAAVSEAELAAQEGIGGRHALVVALLNQAGFIVVGTSWEIIRFAQRLLSKGWRPGTEPKQDPDTWDW